jgi:hypothetical protein
METIFQNNLCIFFLIMLWVLPWKAWALWTAAKNNHRWWFIALILVNSIAILDIVYLFVVAKKRWADVRSFFGSKV